VIPLADRVLIKPDPVVSETASGLSLVEDWPQETSGVITSAGAAVHDVRVGDRVLFGQHAGQIMEFNGERLFVMRERDLIAVI
jgi:chaperonin GroES